MMNEPARPYSWETLRAMTADTILLRSDDVIAAYAAHKEAIIKSGMTVDQYVNETILGSARYILCPNMFRYDIDPSVKHMVFWMQPDQIISTHEAKKIIAHDTGAQDDDIIICESPPGRKSVPLVAHYQVFIRGGSQSRESNL